MLTQKQRNRYAATLRKLRTCRRGLGLCYDCDQFAVPYATRCEQHLEVMRQTQNKYFEKVGITQQAVKSNRV